MQASFDIRKLALMAFVASCAKARGDGNTGSSPLPAASSPPTVGERVVVENATATFLEGVVSSLDRGRVTVELTPSGKVIEQPLSAIYVPDRDNEGAAPRLGSFAICRMADGNWRGCRLESLAGRRATVADEDAAPQEIDARDLLVPTAVSELNVRQRFDQRAKRRAFREGAKNAVYPRIPAGWRPRVNEKVLARRNGEWVGAQLKELRRAGARVAWDDDRHPADVSLSDMAPHPPVEFSPTAGTYVLAHPAPGLHPWIVARVESAGELSIVVSDETGERYSLAPRDVLPLDRGEACP